MRFFKKKAKVEFKEFDCQYENQEVELYVLISDSGGSGYKGTNHWVAQMPFLAYVERRTNQLKKGDGRLVWPLTEEEQSSRSYFNRLNQGTIYRVKARALIDRRVPEGRLPSFYNRFYVTQVLEESAECPPLEEILAEYRKPIVLQDDVLGELLLNKDLGMFNGHAPWVGEEIRISLDVDKDREESWTQAMTAMKTLLSEQEQWHERMRSFSADQLIELANEWQENNDEEEEPSEISRQDFMGRMSIESISMDEDGSFSIYYDDGDLFWGHVIVVYGDLRTGLTSANIEG